MGPSNNNAGAELPPPVIETGSLPDAQTEAGKSSIEQQPSPAFEKAAGSGVSQAMPATIPLPTAPIPTSTSTQTDASTTTSASSLQIPDDKDLIEKEWVNKAKAIVNQTQSDPYKQSEGLTLLKADYMKKQFNKTIKLNK